MEALASCFPDIFCCTRLQARERCMRVVVGGGGGAGAHFKCRGRLTVGAAGRQTTARLAVVAAVLDLHRRAPLRRAVLYEYDVADVGDENNLKDCIATADGTVRACCAGRDVVAKSGAGALP